MVVGYFENMKDQPLQIGIENEQLVIRIGISALAFGVQSGDDWSGEVIADELQFAKDVVRELEREDEAGSTKFHFLLDELANKAVENGSAAISESK
jgi:hypothetical protein